VRFGTYTITLGLLVGVGPGVSSIHAQQRAARASNGGSDGTYERRFSELMALAPDRGTEVHNLVLQRDAAKFTFESGRLYALSPVGGRTVGVLFVGRGRFALTPPTRIEQDRLARFQKTASLDAAMTEAVLLFADSTYAELEHRAPFTGSDTPGRGRVKTALNYLADDDTKTFDPDLMSAFLNGETSDLFYAHVERESGGPVMFSLNPYEPEGVTLSVRKPRVGLLGASRDVEVVCRFARQGQPIALEPASDRAHRAVGRRYTIETTLTSHGVGADLAFAAATTVEFSIDAPAERWVVFSLDQRLEVDSARWDSGGRAAFYKGPKSPYLWVQLERPMEAGETRRLVLAYHGDLFARRSGPLGVDVDAAGPSRGANAFGDFFFIDPGTDWYPTSLDSRSLATYDLTFHGPKTYMLASVGQKVDSSVVDRVTTSRWITPAPIRNASFNVGLFENYLIQNDRIPAVDVMISEEAHRKLAKVFRQQRKMRETVANDVTRSLEFYQHVYGPLPIKHLYATEIPWFEGLAYPGRIDLSWVTFQVTSDDGFQEMFRAHEVAHQWWGIGVDFTTYRDQWISEGFSNFSGLWYMQTARKDNDRYFRMLREWRDHILVRRDEPAPIALGYRAASSKDENGYGVIVYEKGGWVLHMLRMMMIDLKTMNEDRFTTLMREFYQLNVGKRVTTEDFRAAVERNIGADMGWFFNEWVYGAAIPSYRYATQTSPAENGKFRIRLHVETDNVPDDFMMYVPVAIDFGDNKVARVRVKVQGTKADIDLPLVPAQPKAVRFNDLDGVLAEVKEVRF
jgi:hypothetical protein